MILTGLAAGGAFLASSPAKAQYSPTPEFTGHIGRTVGETKTAYPLHNPKAKPGSRMSCGLSLMIRVLESARLSAVW